MNTNFLCKIYIEREKDAGEGENSAVLVLGRGDFINGRHLVGLDPKVVSQERNRCDIIANISDVQNDSMTISAAGKGIQLSEIGVSDAIIDDSVLGRFRINLLDIETNEKYLGSVDN